MPPDRPVEQRHYRRIGGASCKGCARHGSTLRASDFMDDDGSKIELQVTISNAEDRSQVRAAFDFAGTTEEIWGNVNAPYAVSVSAIFYCLRAMVDRDIPLNQGCLVPIDIHIPKNCFLNPSPVAAVVGGNVLSHNVLRTSCLRRSVQLRTARAA